MPRMSSVAAGSPARAAVRWAGRRELLSSRVIAVAAGACALTAVSLAFRSTALGAGFWIDEGLTAGISSHDLLDIPGVLRQDGSPPLWYLLAHLWTEAIGSRSEVTLHLLSLVFALLTVPVAVWAGRSLFGARAGWLAGGLAAVNPYLTYYAQEARMYSLLVLLGLVFAATFLHAFAFGRRRYLVPFAVSLALLLYTHAWALFLAVAAVLALVPLLRAAPNPQALRRDAVLAFGGAALAFAPWLPTLVSQVRHTGAPWAVRPGFESLLGVPQVLLGGEGTALALLIGGGAGLVAAFEGRRERSRDALLALALLCLAGVCAAFVASQISPAWATRYFATFLGPLLLLAGAALARARNLGLAVAAIVLVLWFGPRTFDVEHKSNEQDLTAEIESHLRPGDLVVVTHPERVPVVSYYLPAGLRYATPIGFVADPGVMDWRDALDRLRAADPDATARRVLAGVRPGQQVLLLRPIIRHANWESDWTSLVRQRSAEWARAFEGSARLERILRAPSIGSGPAPRGVRGLLYRVTQ